MDSTAENVVGYYLLPDTCFRDRPVYLKDRKRADFEQYFFTNVAAVFGLARDESRASLG